MKELDNFYLQQEEPIKEDLPLTTINKLLQKALNLYRTGEIKINA